MKRLKSLKKKLLPAYTEAYALMKVWLEAQRDYDKLRVSVTLVHEEATDWSFAIGEAARGVPLTTASQFSICSISKLFTAIAVMHWRNKENTAGGSPYKTFARIQYKAAV